MGDSQKLAAELVDAKRVRQDAFEKWDAARRALDDAAKTHHAAAQDVNALQLKFDKATDKEAGVPVDEEKGKG